MRDGSLNSELFSTVIGGLVAQAAAGGRRVRIFGEMVALLAGQGEHAAVIRLETFWNQHQKRQRFSLFCAYPMHKLGQTAVGDICAQHSSVIPAESYMTLPAPDDRLRAIAVLQQKATHLEDEIAVREQTEERLQVALAAERQARAAAEDALRARDEFLSVAAHELKTPMTSLRGYSQLARRRLERDGLGAQERLAPALQAVEDQTGKLARLVDRLLDVSRLEAGKLNLERQRTDVTALVERAVSEARSWSDKHTITLLAPAGVEAYVDPLQLRQVLTNLLDNAIKYSPDGGAIEVTVQAGEAMREISVRDFGLGIPPGQRGQIFERFQQAHESGSQSGLGLGLYISRQIVELHGGQIRAEFPSAGGTRIVLHLPI
jgi:signal transduction histidine kinase